MECPLDELYKKLGGAGLQAGGDYEVCAWTYNDFQNLDQRYTMTIALLLRQCIPETLLLFLMITTTITVTDFLYDFKMFFTWFHIYITKRAQE